MIQKKVILSSKTLSIFRCVVPAACFLALAGNLVSGSAQAQSPAVQSPPLERFLSAGTVVPVSLNSSLSSSQSRIGDHFTASIVTSRSGYARMRGMLVEGVVTDAAPKDGQKPGILYLSFRRVYGPHGSMPIHGGAVLLTRKYVDMDQAPYRVKPSYQDGPLTGSTYKQTGKQGHDISLKRDEQIGVVVL